MNTQNHDAMLADPEGLARFICSTIELACNRPANSVTPASSLLSLNMDSITLLSVLAQVEAVYTFELQPLDMMTLLESTRISDLVDRLQTFVSHGRA